MERRKDNKGRVLKEGESQRKDGLYQYRWTDKFGKRRTIYSGDLKELRVRIENLTESEIQGIDPIANSMTVKELVKKYSDLHKPSLKETTTKNIDTFMKILSGCTFANKTIASITPTEAKVFMKELYDKGYCYGTINNYKGILRPAFELACDDKILSRNPFGFQLSKVVTKENKTKTILSNEQFSSLVDFCKKDIYLSQHVDELIILYETGLRVSEFCGLTVSDIDLEQGIVNVNHQLVYLHGEFSIQSPKTKSGVRIIPMSRKAREAFSHIISTRPQLDEEPSVSGYSGFLQVSYKNSPRSAVSVESNVRQAIQRYNKVNPQEQLPTAITPHTLRHMFCTRMVESGMNIKAVQYVMGHSKVNMTLDVYSHVDAEKVVAEFRKMIQ